MSVILYPYTNPSSGRFRKRGIYATGRDDRIHGRGGRFNGLGCGKGCVGRGGQGRGGNGQECHELGSGAYENEIDISDFTRYLKMQSGPHSQTIQEKEYQTIRYALSLWLIKRYGPPSTSVPQKTRIR